MKSYFVLFFLWSSVLISSPPIEEFSKNSEKLELNDDTVCVVSSFDERDYFTMFSLEGELLLEFPFYSKIISWKVREDLLFIFSQDRRGSAFYLSCIDMQKKIFLWEKVVYAPGAAIQ